MFRFGDLSILPSAAAFTCPLLSLSCSLTSSSAYGPSDLPLLSVGFSKGG